MTAHRTTLAVLAVLALSGTCWELASAADEAVNLNLIPWPKSVKVESGNLALSAESRIVAADAKLMPLAELLSGEIEMVTGAKLKAAQGSPKAGDVVLKIDPSLKGEEYSLRVSDRALVAGGDYQAVAGGTATLLQAIQADGGTVTLPHLTIADEPAKPYRGVLIDVARRYNSIEDLRKCVVLCRLYKVRYMHLHLSDDQAWTFPSKAFPKLGSSNRGFRGPAPKVYKLQDLKDLVAFADQRGVTLVPELDVPGHTDTLRIPYPETFDANDGPAHMGLVDMANPKAYEGLATLIGEVCEVFKSSPYFHIGADEANLGRCKVSPQFKEFVKAHGLTEDPYDLYCHFIVEMDKAVKKNGRHTLVWADFHGTGSTNATIPTDVIGMSWRDDAGSTENYIKNGYSVINANWTPLYIVNQTTETVNKVEDARGKHRPETIYAWNVYLVKDKTLPPADKMIGAQICCWEQGGEIQVPSLRPRLPAMCERVWNPDAGKTFEDFAGRLKATDRVLDRLLPEGSIPGKQPM